MPLRPNMALRPALLTASLAILSACAAVGPDYHPPTSGMPSSFKGADGSQTAAKDADLAAWWRGFHDATLDTLITRAMADNLDVRTAISRVLAARAQERIAGAASQPSLNASAQGSETHLSKNGGLTGLSKALSGGHTPIGLPGTSFQTWQGGLDAGWELDVFGGVRRSVEAARASTAAETWNLRDAQVSLAAEIATDYLGLRASQVRLGIAAETLAVGQEELRLVQARARNGLATTGDVSAEAARVADLQAAPPVLEGQITTSIDALAVLVGRPPESLAAELAAPAALPASPPAIPAGLPSDLLRRRPDIRRAERQLAAATAQVGVATADLYPSFNLTGSGDLISTALSNLVSSDSLQGVITGAVRWPILDGGRIRGNIAATEQARSQAEIAWQRSVLGALRDVEDALALYASDVRREDEFSRAVADREAGLTSAEAVFHSGQAPASVVLDARSSLLDARDQQAQGALAVGKDVALIYKALGGGWTDVTPTQARRTEP